MPLQTASLLFSRRRARAVQPLGLGSTTRRRTRSARAAAALAAAVLSVAAFAASSAHAGTIKVWACHQPDYTTPAPLDGWSWQVNAAGIYPWNTCSPGSSSQYFGMGVYQQSHPDGSYGAWQFTAPANTSVTALSYYRGVGITGYTDYGTFTGSTPGWLSSSQLEACQPPNCTGLSTGMTTFSNLSTSGLLLYLRACTQAAGCDNFSSGWVAVSTATVTLDDEHVPTFSALTGTLDQPGPLHGTVELDTQLADAGTGLYRIHMSVDGTVVDNRIIDTNGGKCQSATSGRDFVYAEPCPLSASASERLDTRALTDGSHDVDIWVEDASGNTTTVFHQAITTANAPVMTDAPTISGTAGIGGQLAASTGAWSPTPTSYSYRWLRCPAAVTSPSDAAACTPVAGATGASYAVGPADAYGRMMVRVTATNASGSASATSAASAIIADAQGRTNAPSPSDGGSSDVIVVPLPGSTSGSGPGASASPIVGLTNPLAGQAGHVPNGTNAGAGARISIAFSTRTHGRRVHVRAVHSRRGQRWVIDGTIVNAQGAPIGGAALESAWQTPGGAWVAHTGIRTLANGHFSFVLPAGPSRKVELVYFAASDTSAFNTSNVLVERVAAPVSLRATPRTVRNKQRVRFSGTVGADQIPSDGVLVTLQASYAGSGWREFATARTNRSGHFAANYRFTRTTMTTAYRFRAVVSQQTGYPFERGASTTVGVLVRP